MTKQVEINGVVYESVPEPCPFDCCKGCVAVTDKSLCNELGYDCTEQPIIWIKKEKPMNTTEQANEAVEVPPKEPTYTVEEVLEAVEQVTDEYFTDHQKKQIIDILTRKNNPEYKLYLELKAKFGE